MFSPTEKAGDQQDVPPSEEDLIDGVANEGIVRMTGLLSLLMPARASIGFAVKGLDGRYRLANKAMERLLCRGSGNLVGKTEKDVVPTPLCQRLARSDQSILDGAPATSEEVDLPMHGRTRHCLWLKLPVLGLDDKVRSIASLVHEVSMSRGTSAMQQMLERLRQTNEELQRAVVELEQEASTDKLTGVWNRRRLEECIESELDRLNRYQHPVSLLLIDIDHFKGINDRNGHGVGDEVLRNLAHLLQGRLRGTDSLARWGGEEFVVLCPNTTRMTAAILAERLRSQVARARFPIVGEVTMSIGVAECTVGESWEDWFRRADEALYRAKCGGRNQIQIALEKTVRNDTSGYVAGNFVRLVWHASYECGDERVDRGHRLLFSGANDLLAAILSGQAANRVQPFVDALLADVLQHFRDEEAVFLAAGFPRAAEHIMLHRELVHKAHDLLAAYHAGQKGVGDIFQYLAYDVVSKHMLGADREFFCYLPAGEAPAQEPIQNGSQRPG